MSESSKSLYVALRDRYLISLNITTTEEVLSQLYWVEGDVISPSFLLAVGNVIVHQFQRLVNQSNLFI